MQAGRLVRSAACTAMSLTLQGFVFGFNNSDNPLIVRRALRDLMLVTEKPPFAERCEFLTSILRSQACLQSFPSCRVCGHNTDPNSST